MPDLMHTLFAELHLVLYDGKSYISAELQCLYQMHAFC